MGTLFVRDLPLLNILSDHTISKLATRRGWTKPYAAAWSLLYFKKGKPPEHTDVLILETQMILKTTTKGETKDDN
jgi:hypothetical protein